MAKKPQKELGGSRNMSTGTKILIGIFAVLMALSMMLPSLAPIFASDTAVESSEEQDEQTSDASTEDAEAEGDAAKDESEAEDEASQEASDIPAVPENETLQGYADQYSPKVEKFQKRLESNPNDLAALLNLGQTYMNWGYMATQSSSTDEEKLYSQALMNKSLEYYDGYLALNDSNAVKVERAMCVSYSGKTDEAIAALTALTEEQPEYPLAWSNLGMLYEQKYDYEKAKECYAKAQETDPDDEYGAKTTAQNRIDAINSSQANFSDLTNENLLGTNSTPEDGLAGVIAQNTNV